MVMTGVLVLFGGLLHDGCLGGEDHASERSV
jgi:hypothetical protein